MNYQWERTPEGMLVLLEEGSTWTGLLGEDDPPAIIIRKPPPLGELHRYVVSGRLVEPPQEYPGERQCMSVVVAAVEAGGGAIT